MIENITKPLIAAAIAFSSVTTTVSRITNYTNYSNEYAERVYNQDGTELQNETVYKTVQYDQIKFGNILEVNTRGIYKYTRDLVNNNYEVFYYTYIETEQLTNNITLQENTYIFNLLSTDYITYFDTIDYDNLKIYYTNSIAQVIEDFINGENYANYSQINQLTQEIETEIQTDYTQKYSDPYSNGGPTVNINPYKYIVVKANLWWDSQNLQDQGGFLQTLNPLLQNVNYSVTYTAQIDGTNYEVVDIPGLMFEILGMPFAWLSTAFNLTLFPGTPYAINISHIIMAILGCLLLIVIVKKVIK